MRENNENLKIQNKKTSDVLQRPTLQNKTEQKQILAKKKCKYETSIINGNKSTNTSTNLLKKSYGKVKWLDLKQNNQLKEELHTNI